jgi:hypothetical protein
VITTLDKSIWNKTCPVLTCNGLGMLWCKEPLKCGKCVAGHTWFYCPIHDKVVIGFVSEFVDGVCLCEPNAGGYDESVSETDVAGVCPPTPNQVQS